ncbi:MAG: class E sortase [Corynebacterium sp.]|nr:class E sortase [Corynebacterium sp.]
MTKSRISFRQLLGELFLTAGALLLLFAFYEAYWTNLAAGRMQAQAQETLDEEWGKERINPRKMLHPQLGDAFARLYIPSFGSDYQFAVVEGTEDANLMRGPGRYSESQMPGQKGNFAIAGHRVGKGAPFNDLGRLKTCDAIVIETATDWVTYRVLPIDATPAPCLNPEQQNKLAAEYMGIVGRHITVPGDVSVIDPIPGTAIAAVDASEGLLTLTTCHPQFSNAERMIIHAMETESLPKSFGQRPSALTPTT